MWEIVNNRRLIVGDGSIAQIAEILVWNGLKKAFFAVSKSAPVDQVAAVLKSVNVDYVLYDKVVGEPDLHVINRGRDLYLESGCDCVVALGGGSVIDAAKAIGMLSANGGLIEEYQMDGRPVTKMPPFFVAIPTTAGTGAEATKVAVIKNNYNGLKKSAYHTSMIADVAVLDPLMTVGVSAKVTAATGMDALSHAVESFVSLNATPLTEMYSLKAIGLISRNLVLACKEPNNIKARENMLLGSYIAGCSLAAGVGLAHIMAQPVGAMFKIPHGDACSIFLPETMRINLYHSLEKYALIAEAMGLGTDGATREETAAAGIAMVEEIRRAVEAPDSLEPYIKESLDMAQVLETVMKTTGHIKCNPRPVDESLMGEIFTRVYS